MDEKATIQVFNAFLNLFGLDFSDIKNLPRLKLYNDDQSNSYIKVVLVEAPKTVATVKHGPEILKTAVLDESNMLCLEKAAGKLAYGVVGHFSQASQPSKLNKWTKSC